ncbi:MAG: WD40 repeat domain-containing protein [Anaerolineales bacterium]|nr:WD40 repeat domain-containing protein [Anaerolineales bacterium]
MINLVLILSLAGCSKSPASTPPVELLINSATPAASPVPSNTPAATATIAATPTETPAPTLTPTALLYAQPATALPASFELISVESAGRVSALAEWGEPTVTDLAWTPDGLILAVANDTEIVLYDPQTRQVVRTLYPRTKGIVDIAFSSRGTWLVAGSRWGTDQTGYISSLELWLGPNWKPLGVLYNAGRALSSFDFSPNGRVFAAAFTSSVESQNSVEFWSTLTWAITGTLQTGPALDVAFSPQDDFLAVTPDRYAIRIWDGINKEWAHRLSTSFTGAVTRIAFSPDGEMLASGHYDGVIRMWDVQTGTQLLTMSTDEVIESLGFSPDGSLLATGGSYQNSLVRIWDSHSGTLLRTLEGHDKGVGYLLFSPGGQYLVTGSYDGTLRLWGIRP